MRAIEYGLQQYGGYSLKDTETNIFVFNDEIKVEPKADNAQSEITERLYHEIEYDIIDNIISIKNDAEIIDEIEFDYLSNTNVTNVQQIVSSTSFVYKDIPLLTSIYKINNKYFVVLPKTEIGEAEYLSLLPSVEVSSNLKTKPAKPTLNTILKDKKMAVVLFVSTDGAQIERAYQSIDILYENEIVLFIEKNEGVNTFGSVVRVKTGANITSLGMFPYKDLSKIVKIYNTDIGSDSFEEILKEHLEDKTEKVYLVKDIFLGFFDKVTSFTTDLTLEALQLVAEEFANGINLLKIDEKSWKYYNEDGTIVENPDLFLPGLSLIKQAQSKNNQKNELDTNKLNAIAIAHLEVLETILKNKVKENQKGSAKESFTKEKAFKKIINLVLEALANAKKFLKNPLGKNLELAEDTFVMYNAFIVGLINGLVEAVKGIFDLIALICKGLITLRETGREVSKNSITYLSLFFEMIENQLEAFINLFSKENLTAIFEFIKKCLLFSLTLPARILNWLTNDNKLITIDKIGYYLGYIIGIIIEIVLEILATGGASTIVEAIEQLGKSFADLFKGILATFSKVAKNGKAFIVDNFIAIFAFIREKSKNIKPFLDDFFTFIESVFAKVKSFIILRTVNGTIRLEIIPIQSFVETVLKLVKTKWVNDLNKVGLQIAKAENEIYIFVHKGEEIFRGTKKEAKEALEEYFKKADEIGLEKYLDEVAEATKIRKTAFVKWASKFEKKFHHHFDGEIVVGKWSKRDATPTLWSQGAHNHTVNGTKINIKEIRKPVVSRIEDIPNDVPFKANVEVIYSNRNVSKQNTSSFFPKNWDINRIKEEISVVYNYLILEGKDFSKPPFKYTRQNTERTFEILIEFDEVGNLTNAYPKFQ